MSNKKNEQNNINKFPYSNEVKQLKAEFKKMIDEMGDEEFLDFSFALMELSMDFDDEEWDEEDEFDEEFDDEDFLDDIDNIIPFPTDEDDSIPF